MNQLEVLDDFNKQLARDRIVNANAAFLGDVYVYFGTSSYVIRSADFFDALKLVAVEPLDFVMTKEYIIDYVRSNFFGGSTVTMVGFNDVYIDGESELNPITIEKFKAIRTLMRSMQLEYDEFIEHINYHLDEIILKGGIY